MSPTRPRRIVRRAVWTLVIVVLLPVWYIGSYWSAVWLLGRGVISLPVWMSMQETVFVPLWLYLGADLPGASEIDAIAQTLYESGDSVMLPWN